jgi:hypothetical protein
MAIDWSTNTKEFWRDSFKKYITCNNNLTNIIQRGEVESHCQMCLPLDTYTDRNIQKTANGYVVSATHNGAEAGFELVINTESNEWSFEWLVAGHES